jgi:hypothetical protein
MTAIEPPRPVAQGGRLWPLEVKAHRALGAFTDRTHKGLGGTVKSEAVPGFAGDPAGLFAA